MVNNKKQFTLQMGKGEPTVIFVNGLGTDLNDFKKIQKQIAKVTATVSYDRPGIGKSESVDLERSIDILATELHDLIATFNIPGKYILVGHSMGGYILRLYAKTYPNEVAALMFIDPSHENFLQSKLAVRTPAEREELTKKSFEYPEYAPAAMKNEFKHFMTTDVELVKDARIPNNIPVTILTAVRVTKKEMQQPRRKQDLEIWHNLHRSWLKDAPQARHIVTEKSGHSIHHDEPELVIAELKRLIENVKSNRL